MKLFIDGAARGNPGEGGVGVLLVDPQGKEVVRTGKYLGDSITNNRAEYMALLLGLEVAIKHCSEAEVYSDSQLLVHQMNGLYKVKHPELKPLHAEAQERVKRFKSIRIHHINREKNRIADELANEAIDQRKYEI